MSKYIHIPGAKKQRLEKVFSVSRVTVWSALNYTTNSNLARNIRKMARTLGGIEVDSCDTGLFRPNCEERFYRRMDGSIQRIVQTFQNDVRVELDYDLERGAIYLGSKVHKTCAAPTIGDWHRFVHEAQLLAESRPVQEAE